MSEVTLSRAEFDFLVSNARSFIDHWNDDEGMDEEDRGEAQAAERKLDEIEEKHKGEGLENIRLKLLEVLAANLQAWDDEEDSVKQEHAELIRTTREIYDRCKV